jgi:hypothetical protein
MPGPNPVLAKGALMASHIYSTAAEAGPKFRIDEAIVDGDLGNLVKIDMKNDAYLKELISKASGGKRAVQSSVKGLQFFMIKGGGEGFLDPYYFGKDASRLIVAGGTTTSSTGGVTMVFDNNDLLAVFDHAGKLIGSALLQRPISITDPSRKNPHMWTEHTANRVYDAWDGRPVTLYRNKNFDIQYFGLMIDDSLGWYDKGRVRVDLHKQEATNGCIFIVDPNTPPYSDKAKLNMFEPQLIKDIQTHIRATAKSNIGTMYVIKIT